VYGAASAKENGRAWVTHSIESPTHTTLPWLSDREQTVQAVSSIDRPTSPITDSEERGIERGTRHRPRHGVCGGNCNSVREQREDSARAVREDANRGRTASHVCADRSQQRL